MKIKEDLILNDITNPINFVTIDYNNF